MAFQTKDQTLAYGDSAGRVDIGARLNSLTLGAGVTSHDFEPLGSTAVVRTAVDVSTSITVPVLRHVGVAGITPGRTLLLYRTDDLRAVALMEATFAGKPNTAASRSIISGSITFTPGADAIAGTVTSLAQSLAIDVPEDAVVIVDALAASATAARRGGQETAIPAAGLHTVAGGAGRLLVPAIADSYCFISTRRIGP